ncbi:MAG: hypothetical protein KDC44_21335 [Phaeodactylibacter sp.]|nr:hypothetical protein [Phaeodactylibacter sp.]
MPAAPSSIRLGFVHADTGTRQRLALQQYLTENDIQCEAIALSAADLEQGLLHGDIELGLRPLERLPLQLPDKLCITALSERDNPADQLIYLSQTKGPLLLGLPQDARVGVPDLRAKFLLLHFRPDLKCTRLPEGFTEPATLLENQEFEALLLPARALPSDPSNPFSVQELNPQEFVPKAGQGVWAFLAHTDNKSIRRWAQQSLHRPDTAELTNVERSVQKQLPPELQSSLGVYCRKDQNAHFHAYAVCQGASKLQFARFSSSTTLGLAEELVRGLVKLV